MSDRDVAHLVHLGGARGVSDRVAELVGAMRAGGARVGVGEAALALRALGAVDATSPEEARLALRAALCARREDLAVFDAAWALVLGRGVRPVPSGIDLPPATSAALPRVAGPPAADPPPAPPAPQLLPDVRPAPWSDVELLRDKDFAAYTDAERALARELLERLARRGPERRSRRMHAARRGPRLDLQRTLRDAMRHGGEPVRLRRRAPGRTARPVVLVLDVSGSMAPYARVLLQYAQAAVTARRRVEAFVFGTRLTRVTRELHDREPDRALARAAAAVEDWSGGTRIGAALGALNREHGRRLGRGAVVVVLSDGWDRGDPDVLAAELRRLRRSAHRLVWLNPLKASPGYAPLARGMAAALPHTDHFLAGHSLRSVEELADLLETAA